jgi:hypothetical protein
LGEIKPKKAGIPFWKTNIGQLMIERVAVDKKMVRAAGIEPASQAWEAHILPMYYAR